MKPLRLSGEFPVTSKEKGSGEGFRNFINLRPLHVQGKGV